MEGGAQALKPHPPVTSADERLDALVRERFDDLMQRYPVVATFLGVPGHDEELADGSREAVLDDAAAARQYLAAIDALDPGELSPYFAIERELAQYTARREVFDAEVHRVWERRVSATDEIGDGLFLLLVRGSRPLADRLASIAARLEQAPRHIEEQKSRLGERPPVRLWNEMELQAVSSLPTLFDEIVGAGREEFGPDSPQTRRLESASMAAAAALEAYAGWVREQLGRATDDFALGSEAYADLVRLREFDGLEPDEILEIGQQQLAENRAGRARIAREIDPRATEAEVVARVKSNHPPDFDAAMTLYRRAMDEARQYIVDHDIATLPAGEQLSVIATPEYLRLVTPFAAYFAPPKFDTGPDRRGIYIVTPSVDGAEGALREHNFASIYNTSIHEAYPGHHLQLAVATENPSLVRALVDAPEFVEGWGMYSEQMMREEGFDTAPDHRLMMHTDAIWRACRIILDVKLHQEQIGVSDAIEFMIDQTGFERPNATAEVERYTYTPTYQLSYLLGKVLLLRLRADEQRRLGDAFSLRRFHDSMLEQGSLPVSFQRRLLAMAG